MTTANPVPRDEADLPAVLLVVNQRIPSRSREVVERPRLLVRFAGRLLRDGEG